MDSTLWYAVSVVVVLIALGILALLYIIWGRRGRRMAKKDYRMFIYVGISYIILGAILSFIYPGEFSDYFYLMLMGTIFISVGLSNLERWKD